MSLSPETIKQMQILSKFTVEEIDGMLSQLATASPEEWRQAVNGLILTLWAMHADTRANARKSIKDIFTLLQSAAPQAPSAPETPATPPPAVVGGGETRMAADGQPLSPEDASVEAMMDAATGVMTPPTAQRQVRAMPPVMSPPAVVGANPMPPAANGGARIGADGRPLSAEEAAIEAMMDNAVVAPG